MGGGPDDEVLLEGLPSGAASFTVVGGALFVDLGVDATVDGEMWEAGTVAALSAGATLTVGPLTVVARAAVPAGGATTPALANDPAREAHFEFLPVGGRLRLCFPSREIALDLSELRARLVAVLLAPPGDLEAGSMVPDEILLEKIWPRKNKQRTDLNTLVHRLRRTLLRHGVHPSAVLHRAPQGGSLQLRLAEDAHVSVT
jgi:hypothetical protein